MAHAVHSSKQARNPTVSQTALAILAPGSAAGHSLMTQPYWGTIGKIYIAFITIYTVILLLAILYAWLNHYYSTALRIRGKLITTMALLAIHIYLAALFIVYPLNGYFLCGTEFWIMNTIFPCSIAIFHASSVRMKAYADQQQLLLKLDCYSERKFPLKRSIRSPQRWWRAADPVRRTYGWTLIGLMGQLIITIFLYTGSRRFMPLSGWFGQATDAFTCRKGWEWTFSIIWQFFFAYVFGIPMLYSTRNLKVDTHYWRVQMRAAVIASMFGAPLWISTLYASNRSSPLLDQINKYWPPAMWFAPGLIAMQLSIVICTALDLRSEARAARSQARAQEIIDQRELLEAHIVNLQGSFQTMQFALKHMYRQFLMFAASIDYTAENVLFVTRVREFKTYWLDIIAKSRVNNHHRLKSRDLKRMYEQAARIYFELVNPKTARFPVNVGSKQMSDLAEAFCRLRYIPDQVGDMTIDKALESDRRPNLVCPWEKSELEPPSSSTQASTPTSIDTATFKELEHGTISVNTDASVDTATFKELDAGTLPINSDASSESETDMITIGLGEASSMRQTASDEDLIATSHSMIPMKTFTPSGSPAITPSARADKKQVRFAEAEHTLKGGFYYINDAILRSPDIHIDDYVPHKFTFNVFDAAETTIRRDIYNNTWKAFVRSLRTEQVQKMDVWPMSTSSVSRRMGRSYSQMTDIEAAEWDTEQDDGLHHGVLDMDKGPIAIEHVDARCGGCRRTIIKTAKQVFKNDEKWDQDVEVIQDAEATAEMHYH